METMTIEAPQDAKYLQDFLSFNELPKICRLDKGCTGCGGTTAAIKDDVPTIIAMPYKNVVIDKAKQHPNLLGVTGDVTEKDIEEYITDNPLVKIAATYDGLAKVVRVFEKCGINPFSTLRLLVDEEHILFRSYIFRNRAIKSLLELSKQFERVIYMTATPIDEEFTLEELKGIPVVNIIWNNKERTEITSVHTEDLVRATTVFIRDEEPGVNLHFFVNSVEFITVVIEHAELSPGQVRVVCSNNAPGRGKKSNQTKLGAAYPIVDITAPVKPINFYTSTAFEGCDILDENGRTYIISDIYKEHTLLDISTLFIQIAGRIRNSKYNNKVIHLFNTSRYRNHTTYEEYKLSTEEQMKASEKIVNDINNIPEDTRGTVIKSLMKTGLAEKYISFEDNRLSVDRNIFLLDIQNYKIVNQVYRSEFTLQKEYNDRGLDLVFTAYTEFEDKDKKVVNKRKASFKDLFMEYATLRRSQGMIICLGERKDRTAVIEQENALVKDAYEMLGEDRVKCLHYNTTNIKRELIKITNASYDDKIVELLIQRGYVSGIRKPCRQIRKDLQEIYADLLLDGKVKATDLRKWFDCKFSSPKINGKTTDCLTIIRRKIIY